MESTTRKNTRAEQARINGAKSKGAKTAEGQQKANTGNFQHGAYAQSSHILLKSENHAAYAQLLATNQQEYDPATALEAQVVQDITNATWQLHRLNAALTRRLEALLENGHEDDALLDQAVIILERRIRQFTTQRSKLILDYQRLKKLTPVIESSRAARNPELYQRIVEVRWVDRLSSDKPEPSNAQPANTQKLPKDPPQHRQAA